MTRLRRTALGALGLPLFLVACRALVGLEGPQGGRPDDAGIADAQGDGGVDAADGAPRIECVPEVPPRPGAGDAGSTGPQWFVMRTLSLRENDQDFPGANLDCESTQCDPDGRLISGRPTCQARRDAAPACDGVGGIDNGLLFAFKGTFEAAVTLGVGSDRGVNGAVLYVGNYNGSDDDNEVSAAVTLSPGILRESSSCKAGDAGDAGDGPRVFLPCWDGQDEWAVGVGTAIRRDNDYADVPEPGLVVPTAYVTKGELVVTGFKDLSFPINGARLTLLRPILRATLTRDANGRITKLRGVGTGILDPVLGNQALRGTKFGDTVMCKNPALFDLFRAQLCSGLDFTADPTRAFAGAPCDAMSVAFRFEAEPIKPYVLQADASVPMTADPCEGTSPPPATLSELCP